MKKSILPAMWDVPQIFRDRLGNTVGRQRAMLADEHLLLVLHAVPKADQAHREGCFYWRQPDGSWSSTESGNGLASLERHLENFREAVEQLEEKEINAKSSQEYFTLLETLAPIHRSACNLLQVLQEARKMVPDDRRLINLRDQAYDLQRNAELLYQGLQNAMTYAVARRAEEQAIASEKMSRAAHKLNMLAAFFFPLVTLSAIFGTNLVHGMESAKFWPWPFVGLIAVGLTWGVVLRSWITRDAR